MGQISSPAMLAMAVAAAAGIAEPILEEAEPQDRVEAEELGIDASEEADGVVHIMAISFRRTTVVIMQDADGVIGIGSSIAWPRGRFDPDIGRAKARRNARRLLAYSRERSAEFHRLRLEAAE